MNSVAAVARVRKILEHPYAQKYIKPFSSERRTLGMIMSQSLDVVDDRPEIADCEPASIVRAIGRAASWNLRIAPRGPALLVAGEGDRGRPKLAAMQTYEGKIIILRRAGLASFVIADVVCEGELVEYESGGHPDIKHRPNTLKLEDRGKIVGSYAWTYVIEQSMPGDGNLRRERIKRIAAVSRGEIIAHMNEWSPRLKGANLDAMPFYALARAVHKLAKLIAAESDDARALLTDDADDDAWRSDLTLTAEGLIDPQSKQEGQLLGRSHVKPEGPPNVRVHEGEQPRRRDALAANRAPRTESML